LCLGIAFLIGHFTFIFFYALPFGTKNKFTFFSQAYVYPFFHQNWNLFAPVPDSNYRLFVEYRKESVHKTDLFSDLVAKHQSNRLAGYGTLVLVFSNSIHYFEKNTGLLSSLNGPVVNDEYFMIIEHEVNNYLVTIEKIKPQKIKITLVVENVLTKKQRVYFN